MRDKTYQRATSTKVQDGADKKKCNNIRKRRGIKKSHTMENSPLLDQRTDHDLQCETDRRCEVTGHDNTLMFYEDKERDRYYLNNKTDVFDGSNINQHDEDTRNRCKITGLINPTTTCDERNTTKYYLNNGAAISNAVNTNLNKSTTYDTPRRNCEITGHENKGISYDEAIKTFEMTERDKTSTYYDDQRNNKCYASDRENGYDGYNKCNKGSNKFTTGYNIQQTTVKRYSAPPTVCNIASTSFYNDKSNNKYCVDNKANESNVPITGTHQNTRPTYAQNTRPIGAPSCDESPTKCDVTGHDNSAKFYDGNQGNQYSFVDTLYQTISKDLLGRSTHGADDRPEPSIKRNCNMDVNVAAKDYRTSTISVRRATDARYDGRNIESEWNTQSSGVRQANDVREVVSTADPKPFFDFSSNLRYVVDLKNSLSDRLSSVVAMVPALPAFVTGYRPSFPLAVAVTATLTHVAVHTYFRLGMDAVVARHVTAVQTNIGGWIIWKLL